MVHFRPTVWRLRSANLAVTTLLFLTTARAAACGATLDAVGTVRNGDDILSAPMLASATIDDCVALCCQTSTCRALSYNNPQPEYTQVGGTACEAGGVCCMLKGAVPLLNGTNPNGAAVRTAVLSLPAGAPGPAPPFPASTFIASAAYSGAPRHWTGGIGDTWPSAWSSDDRLYAWSCDTSVNGTGSPMAFFELAGDPYAGALDPIAIAIQPIDYVKLCAPYHPGPNVNTKPGGVLALNGTIYTGVTCITYGQDSTLFVRQHDLAGFIAMSRDAGRTWTNATPVGAFPGRFAAPTFVNCGPGLPCGDPDSSALSWVYAFFTGASWNNYAYWENGDAHFLARVAPGSVTNAAAYQYYVGMSGGNLSRPQWSPDSTQAQPVLSYGRMIGQNAVHYNAELKRWLVVNYGFINDVGNPWPWHQDAWHALNIRRRTQLLMLEAPQPWGPWSVFFRDDDAGAAWGAYGMYGTTLPARWHRPVNTTTQTAEMMMIFSCGNGLAGCFYTLNYVPVTVTLT